MDDGKDRDRILVSLRLEDVSMVSDRLHQLSVDASPVAGRQVHLDIEVLSQLEEHLHCEASIAGLLAATRYCYLSQQVPIAIRASGAAVLQARNVGDKCAQRKALTFHAIMQAESGNLLEATRYYSEAASIAEELGDAEQMRPVLNNLALLFCHLGQHADGLRCLKRALALPSKTNIPPSRGSLAASLVSISHCCLALRMHAEGADAAGKAIRLLSPPLTADELLNRVLAEVNLSRIALEEGDLSVAEAHYRAAVESSSGAHVPRGDHAISVLRGLIDVYVGRIEPGLDQLRAGLDRARKFFPSDLPDALSVCVTAFDSASRPDAALTYLHELLAIQKEVHARGLKEQLGWLTSDARPAWELDESQRLLSSTAARLGAEVRKKIDYLTDTAAAAAISAGYDARRTFRVARLAELFAQYERWERKDVASVKLAAQLADIGMIAISERILTKAGSLSRAERKLVEEHTRFGAELLMSACLDTLVPCIEVARFHHERCDGSGPFGMEGPAIPRSAQVVALCDAFDAMTQPRPWRGALSVQAAVREIERNSKNWFEPVLSGRFAQFIKEEFWRHDDFAGFLGDEASSSSFVRAREHIAAVINGR